MKRMGLVIWFLAAVVFVFILAETGKMHVLFGILVAAAVAGAAALASHGTVLASLVFTRRRRQSVSEAQARRIMGENFHGSEDALSSLGEDFPREAVINAFCEVPFSARVLKRCRKTHVLVAVLPISIIEMRHMVSRGIFHYTRGDDCDGMWYHTEPFADKKGVAGWHLVPLAPVHGSWSKTWSEQVNLLGEDERVLSARVLVYTILIHYLKTGQWLFEDHAVRCAEERSGGGHVTVGSGHPGISIGDFRDAHNVSDGNRYSTLGFAAERKPDAVSAI